MVVASGGGGNAWAKEMTIRRRMASIFNKTQEHFPSLKDYNDYLEEVEDMTFNLIEGIDVEAIEAKITSYQQENAEQIYLSRAKRAEDLAAALKASRMNPAKADANDTAAEAPRALAVGWEFKANMHLLLFLVGWLSLVRQVWPRNQLVVHQILFKGDDEGDHETACGERSSSRWMDC